MERVYSSEKLVSVYESTWRQNPQQQHRHINRLENHKTHFVIYIETTSVFELRVGNGTSDLSSYRIVTLDLRDCTGLHEINETNVLPKAPTSRASRETSRT